MIRDPTHTLALRALYARQLRGLFRRFIKSYLEALSSYMEMIAKRNTMQGIMLSIDDAMQGIDNHLDAEVNSKAPAIINKNTENAYKGGLRNASRQLKRYGLLIGINPMPRDIEAMGILKANSLSLVKALGTDAKKDIIRIISEGYMNGWGIPQMSREIRGKVGTMTRYRADMIARTETIRAYNEAARNTYKKAGVKKYIWVAAYGERTCPECADRDGNIYDMDDSPPPLHPNCRCSISPVIEWD